MWYFLNEEEERIRQAAAEVAKQIAPAAFDWEMKSPGANVDSFRIMQQKKLLALHVPKELGGEGANFVAWCLAQEEVAKVDLAASNTISHEAVVPNVLLNLATKEQCDHYLTKQAQGDFWGVCVTEPQGGSDMGNIQTKAVLKDGKYVLNGKKAWVLNGDVADRHLLWASTDSSKKIHGLSVFIIEKGTPGLKVSEPYNKLGWKGVSCCDLDLDNVEIPEANLVGKEGDGFNAFLCGLNPGRVGIAAQALGLAEGAYECALDYATKRIEFGQPISNFQAVKFRLANMATSIESGRALVYTTARLIDQKHKDADKLTAMAKCELSDIAVNVTTSAIEIMGGAGYKSEYPVERMNRDAHGLRIADGSNDIMRVIVASLIIPRQPRAAK
ncbi:acyl-CoA dehydrogenase family protein [Chloroflexota bacterium]